MKENNLIWEHTNEIVQAIVETHYKVYKMPAGRIFEPDEATLLLESLNGQTVTIPRGNVLDVMTAPISLQQVPPITVERKNFKDISVSTEEAEEEAEEEAQEEDTTEDVSEDSEE